ACPKDRLHLATIRGRRGFHRSHQRLRSSCLPNQRAPLPTQRPVTNFSTRPVLRLTSEISSPPPARRLLVGSRKTRSRFPARSSSRCSSTATRHFGQARLTRESRTSQTRTFWI